MLNKVVNTSNILLYVNRSIIIPFSLEALSLRIMILVTT